MVPHKYNTCKFIEEVGGSQPHGTTDNNIFYNTNYGNVFNFVLKSHIFKTTSYFCGRYVRTVTDKKTGAH